MPPAASNSPVGHHGDGIGASLEGHEVEADALLLEVAPRAGNEHAAIRDRLGEP